MIYVNIHADVYAELDVTNGFPVDYTTTHGDTYFNDFNLIGVPIFLINRLDTTGGSTGPVVSSYFSTRVEQAVGEVVQIPSPIDMSLNLAYDDINNQLDIDLYTQLQTTLVGDNQIVLYFIEDSLISAQYGTSGNTITNYVHRNVLRDVINGTWGGPYCSGTTNSGTQLNSSYQYTPDPSWDLENCKVITYVRRVSDHRIMQVAHRNLANSVEVEKSTMLGQVVVFPNPNDGVFTVQVPATSVFLDITITDLMGNQVANQKIVKDQIFDLSDLPTGVYLLNVTGGDQVYVDKIIIR